MPQHAHWPTLVVALFGCLVPASVAQTATPPRSAGLQEQLQDAVRRGDSALVRTLVAAGADPSQPMPDGRSLLQLAVFHDRCALLRAFVEGGADVDARDEHNSTVLQYAVFVRQRACVKELIRLGADLDAVNGQGQTVDAVMRAPDCHGIVTHWDQETWQLVESRRSGTPQAPIVAEDRPGHTFRCPMIALESVTGSGFKTGWPSGYPSSPAQKERLPDGKTRLFCETQIGNPSFGIRLSQGYELDACRASGASWVCGASEDAVFHCPTAQARDASGFGYGAEAGISFPSVPSYKGLQSEGELILECRTKANVLAMSLTIDEAFDFDSCGLAGTDWRCARQ